ncbi:MAG: hypothetical protein WB791_08390 [Waddliaceae bacterium]
MFNMTNIVNIDSNIRSIFKEHSELGAVMTVIVKTLFKRKTKESVELELRERIEKMNAHIEKIREFQDKHSEEFQNIHEEFNLYVPCYTIYEK